MADKPNSLSQFYPIELAKRPSMSEPYWGEGPDELPVLDVVLDNWFVWVPAILGLGVLSAWLVIPGVLAWTACHMIARRRRDERARRRFDEACRRAERGARRFEEECRHGR